MKTVFKIPSRIGKFFLWFVFSFFVMSSSYSQQIPNAGQELRKQQQQKSFKSLPTIIPNVASPVEEIKKKPKKETTIHVKKFILTGYGYGFGLKADIPGRFDIDLTVARRIGNNPAKDIVTGKDSDGSLDETRFWFSTSLLF